MGAFWDFFAGRGGVLCTFVLLDISRPDRGVAIAFSIIPFLVGLSLRYVWIYL